jgi:hypothetical protein
VERRFVRAQGANADLTVLPADGGKAAVVNSVRYNQKVALEDQANRKLNENSTKTVLIRKMSSSSEAVFGHGVRGLPGFTGSRKFQPDYTTSHRRRQ